MPELVQPGSSHPLPAVELDRVSKIFGNFAALREVSLAIPAGSSVVLLGENGAGKSTLMKMVSGLWTPSFGKLRVFGLTPADQRGRIATMGHASMLYDELTGMENLEYFARLYTLEGQPAPRSELQARAAAALRAVALDPANTRRVGEYSQGMRQRASLARVLLTEPDLLLLDEPFSNLDVQSAHAMIDRLLAWVDVPSADGTPRTLMLITHQAELASPLARTTVTLRQGKVATIQHRQEGAHA
ncbi:ABC-type multidrug transport system, ATPase component [Bryocella elongata]|uniref:ABC-type multidrug transport system, ATPase component n=1 Tax=Bryocella elongata TaxID=863522 RepID=A0A1H5SK64_9BACT|nr:ABC transporter ATP-binding protein [Bryocella elongata]SEF51022.1 ABC-type multidrug transport system, ATPase component [Bryocella elongata]